MNKETKQQVVIIHGGDVFESYEDYFDFLKNEKEPRFETMMDKDWKDTIQDDLGSMYDVVTPSMPNKQNAQYKEWKIWFEKHTPYLDEDIIFVGHSLGGIFLAKYLSENTYPKDIKATFLVAAPYDMTGKDYSPGNFQLTGKLSNLSEQSENIFLYHSKDDAVVPLADFKKYESKLPEATERVFEDKGHFSGDLPEIAQDIHDL